MPRLSKPRKTSLKNFCLTLVVDYFDCKYLIHFYERWKEVTDENKPYFGPFKDLDSAVLIILIEELIRREELTYRHLKVLLPRDAKSLTCDESTEYTPFKLETIELISLRCPDFQVLHYHEFVTDRWQEGVCIVDPKLWESIHRLSLLRIINLSDTRVDFQTLRVISTKCPKLKYLNLHNTNVNDEMLRQLYDYDNVIQDCLATLIIYNTNLVRDAALDCLLTFKNLTHFEYGDTISKFVSIFDEIINGKIKELVTEFKSTIFRSSMNMSSCVRALTRSYQEWLVERFPEVTHLILTDIGDLDSPFNDNSQLVNFFLRKWKNISHLELSAGCVTTCNLFEFYPAFDCCKDLVNLKLEGFVKVDIYFLGSNFRKLEKLTLINCSFLKKDPKSPLKRLREIKSPFENLREIEICFFRYNNAAVTSSEGNYQTWQADYPTLRSILSCTCLEKVLMYDQCFFESDLIKELVRKGSLKNLKELNIFFCPLTIDGIIYLFSELIPVKKIVIGFCPYIRIEEAKQITKMIEREDYETSFLLAKEVPYRLRWLVLSVKSPVQIKNHDYFISV